VGSFSGIQVKPTQAEWEEHSSYADTQPEVYPFSYVSAAAEQSAPTARLLIPHLSPQPPSGDSE
jgi:hypothetical protein